MCLGANDYLVWPYLTLCSGKSLAIVSFLAKARINTVFQ